MRGDQWRAVSAQSSVLHCVSVFTPYYHIINAEDSIGLTLKTLWLEKERKGKERKGKERKGKERIGKEKERKGVR